MKLMRVFSVQEILKAMSICQGWETDSERLRGANALSKADLLGKEDR